MIMKNKKKKKNLIKSNVLVCLLGHRTFSLRDEWHCVHRARACASEFLSGCNTRMGYRVARLCFAVLSVHVYDHRWHVVHIRYVGVMWREAWLMSYERLDELWARGWPMTCGRGNRCCTSRTWTGLGHFNDINYYCVLCIFEITN